MPALVLRMATELTSCPDANLEVECRAYLILAPAFHEGTREERTWSSGLGCDLLLSFQSSVSPVVITVTDSRHMSTESRPSASSNGGLMAPG